MMDDFSFLSIPDGYFWEVVLLGVGTAGYDLHNNPKVEELTGKYVSIIMKVGQNNCIVLSTTPNRVSAAGKVNDEVILFFGRSMVTLPAPVNHNIIITPHVDNNTSRQLIDKIIMNLCPEPETIEEVPIERFDNTMKDVRNYL